MPVTRKIEGLDSLMAINAISHTLHRLDPRLVDHGERVAFITCEIREEGNLPLDEEQLLLLSIFHDIGAYKTEEIDRMVEFETSDVDSHAIYGYLFLKHMTPLADKAETLLYHHASWDEIVRSGTSCGEYASLIHLADRMDIVFLHKNNNTLYEKLIGNKNYLFRPEYVEMAHRCFIKRRLFERLADGSYRQTVSERIKQAQIPPKLALEYLQMLVYSIDFRSEHTVTHTVNTTSIALNIAEHFQLSSKERDDIYLGALLHDVGKICIPPEILEHPGSLTKNQMEIMRTHVAETENIIRGIVPENICNIAVRHHEKLDGTGYPHGLMGDELSFPQRIVAVADVASALVSRRSYKEPFPKEKTLAILQKMCGDQLDAQICTYLCNDYDRIVAQTDNSRNAVIQTYQAMINEASHLFEKS